MNSKSKKAIILSIVIIIVIVIIISILIKANISKIVDNLITYTENQFPEDFEEYISKLNVTGISVKGTYEFVNKSYDKKRKVLDIICKPKYTSDNISDYYTDVYNSSDARELCNLLKNINQVANVNGNYQYSYDDIGEIYIRIIDYDNFHGIAILGSDNNIYEYKYIVDYNEVLINDNYIFMESDGSYVPSITSNSNSKDTEVKDDDERNICWSLARDTVKTQLKSPSSAKFPFSYASEDVSITKSGNIYTVRAWVEAENSFGADIRSDFTVSITKSGSNFTAESCVID